MFVKNGKMPGFLELMRSLPKSSLYAIRAQHDAWDKFRSQSGKSFNTFTFTGHEKDIERDMYYFKARYYDADTGRFPTQESYLGEAQTPPSLHRYRYAYGKPTVWATPTSNYKEGGHYYTTFM